MLKLDPPMKFKYHGHGFIGEGQTEKRKYLLMLLLTVFSALEPSARQIDKIKIKKFNFSFIYFLQSNPQWGIFELPLGMAGKNKFEDRSAPTGH